MQQERAWVRRAYPGIKYKWSELVVSSSLKKGIQKAEQKFINQQSKTRQLLVDLAARAYQLENGHRPASVADLAPDYLKAVPKDPASGANLVLTP
jgi:hypothetical protein